MVIQSTVALIVGYYVVGADLTVAQIGNLIKALLRCSHATIALQTIGREDETIAEMARAPGASQSVAGGWHVDFLRTATNSQSIYCGIEEWYLVIRRSICPSVNTRPLSIIDNVK